MSRTSEAAKPRGVAKVFEASVCTAPCQQGVQIHTSRSACACINASLTWAERVKPSLTVDGQKVGRGHTNGERLHRLDKQCNRTRGKHDSQASQLSEERKPKIYNYAGSWTKLC